MRSIIFALALALLVSSVFAKPPELQALASVTSFEGWNCNPTGGPYTFTATIYIANPYNGTMTVNYTYYDYYAGRETDGGRVCMIQANNEDHCSFTIPVTLGGEAAGNASRAAMNNGYGAAMPMCVSRGSSNHQVDQIDAVSVVPTATPRVFCHIGGE